MIGLIVLVVGAIYLALLVWATRGAYRWAKREGLSKTKCWVTAAGVFLVVYLPVFWDHIPTLMAHQYYCMTEGGFRALKTVEQWKSENPGVAEKLKRFGENINEMPHSPNGDALINDRFREHYQRESVGFFPIKRRAISLVDRATGDVVASDVDFRSGYGNPMTGSDWRGWKFWLNIDSCFSPDTKRTSRGLAEFRDQLIKFGGRE